MPELVFVRKNSSILSGTGETVTRADVHVKSLPRR